MKYFSYISCVFLILSLNVNSLYSQTKSDDICGYFIAKDPFSSALSRIKIYKTTDGTYSGKIIQIENESDTKYNNYLFLRNLRYDSLNNVYVGGKIKYPSVPGIYKTNISIQENGNLKVRGYVGISVFGFTVYFERENSAKQKQ